MNEYVIERARELSAWVSGGLSESKRGYANESKPNFFADSDVLGVEHKAISLPYLRHKALQHQHKSTPSPPVQIITQNLIDARLQCM